MAFFLQAVLCGMAEALQARVEKGLVEVWSVAEAADEDPHPRTVPPSRVEDAAFVLQAVLCGMAEALQAGVEKGAVEVSSWPPAASVL